MSHYCNDLKKWFVKNKDKIRVGIVVYLGGNIIINIIYELIKIIPKSFADHKSVIINYLINVLDYSVAIKIYQIILYIILWIMLSRIRKKNTDRNKKLKIIEAKYYTDDLHSLDITGELDDAIENDKLKIVLSNNIAGDPEKGKRKRGMIKYSFDGQGSKVEIEENDLIDIP